MSAADILRGVAAMMAAEDLAMLAEVPLPSGHRADVMALDRKGGVSIIEIKSSLADFQADAKWPAYRDWCDRFYFAVAPDFPRDRLPDETGLILADAHGAARLIEAPLHRIAGARRSSLILRFARLSARRLAGAEL